MVISGVSATGYVRCVPEKKQKAKPPVEWAEWVHKARLESGLTQEQFAEKIDYSRGAVADWERRENNIELPAVVSIMQVFPHSPAPPIRGFSERPPMVKAVPAAPPFEFPESVVVGEFLEATPEEAVRVAIRDAVAELIPIVRKAVLLARKKT